jgi:hypothetical protein
MGRSAEFSTVNLIQWGLRPNPFNPAPKGLRFSECAFLLDQLDWGPQHVDLALQDQMRHCFFRAPVPSIFDLGDYLQVLQSGQEVAFANRCWETVWGSSGCSRVSPRAGSTFTALP